MKNTKKNEKSENLEVRPNHVSHDFSLLNSDDLHWFNEGTHFHLYQKLGAHAATHGGKPGTYFAVWAPNAERVTLVGDFNGWNKSNHPLRPKGSSGIWEGFVPGIHKGATYKYHIASRHNGYNVDKADPVGFFQQTSPQTASVVWDLNYSWQDQAWMTERGNKGKLEQPISVYEVHLGSWMRVPEENRRSLTYRELASNLADYVSQMGFTHVELLPITEHPFFGSWGYQTTGYFAPTSRYGNPHDLMHLIDCLHQRGIGVILDWVPSHFPGDEHGLIYFDGTHLYEHADMQKGFHQDWKSYIFNYGRHEVRSFLISSALFWLDHYHIDALRVDAVASMLYLDYSRKSGEWIPNQFGGRENLEAIDFLRRFNQEVYKHFPDTQTFAEESTSWPMVSRPLYVGGLGFGFKWDMGWMHDTLNYFKDDPVHRKYHHNQLTFRGMYAFSENFMLTLSHDEVVHGKGSLLNKMPGDEWQKFANLRLLFAFMFAQPGKKLLFMGGEFGQWQEWNHDASLDWHLTESPLHAGVQRLVGDLNRAYRSEPALHAWDCNPEGFSWIDCHDSEQSTLSWLRRGPGSEDIVAAVFNFTPVPRHYYRLGVPEGGSWREILNTDAADYGGGNVGNFGSVEAAPIGWHNQPYSLTITAPPLAAIFFKKS
ncbi:MAG: 1,4-alpha-glucan branching protein GlgB [Verrucomicrobia bacterium]|nr:1,4-alpha-glucan branching protein GlgB [Verrucomicrobiota bacterium]